MRLEVVTICKNAPDSVVCALLPPTRPRPNLFNEFALRRVRADGRFDIILTVNPLEFKGAAEAATFAVMYFDSTDILCPTLFVIVVQASILWSNNLERIMNHV
jgi:hypothetical protein